MINIQKIRVCHLKQPFMGGTNASLQNELRSVTDELEEVRNILNSIVDMRECLITNKEDVLCCSVHNTNFKSNDICPQEKAKIYFGVKDE